MRVPPWRVGEPDRMGAVLIHDVNLGITVTVGRERDMPSVVGPLRKHVVRREGRGRLAKQAAADEDRRKQHRHVLGIYVPTLPPCCLISFPASLHPASPDPARLPRPA